MNPGLKVGAFALGLVVVAGTAALVGVAVGPTDHGTSAHHAGHDTGMTLRPEVTTAGVGTNDYRFRILGADGTPVVAYATRHDRNLHLVVVRHDLSGFQHVHPTLAPDGTWSSPLTFATSGAYRVFADFQPAGGDPAVVSSDLTVPGATSADPLPSPTADAVLPGDLKVHLDGTPVAGRSTRLTFTVLDGGQPAALQPYLGANGHLVVLRAGDLEYLHVHPIAGGAPGTVSFDVDVPKAGAHRLFLEVRIAGEVRTAAFTVAVGEGDR